jgi:hypothetical protein
MNNSIFGKSMENILKHKNVKIVNTEEKFILYLVNHINGNYDILCDLCNKIGDTYYKDGWDFQIDTHELKI